MTGRALIVSESPSLVFVMLFRFSTDVRAVCALAFEVQGGCVRPLYENGFWGGRVIIFSMRSQLTTVVMLWSVRGAEISV